MFEDSVRFSRCLLGPLQHGWRISSTLILYPSALAHDDFHDATATRHSAVSPRAGL